MGDEGALEVDARDLSGERQLRQGLGTRSEHLGRGRHAGGDKGCRPVAAMLLDGDEGCLGSLGVGEGLPATAVAMHIDEAGEERRIGGLGQLALVVGRGTYTGNGQAVDLDDSILDDGILQDKTAAQHTISHANIVAHLTLHRCVLDNHFSHSSNARRADSSRDWHPGATTT